MECTADVIGLMGAALTIMTLIILIISILGLDGTGTLDLYVTRVRDLNEEIETLEDADGETLASDITLVIIMIISGQMEASVGWGCFKQGPISLNVKIPKSGFVCGETAKVDVKVMQMISFPHSNNAFDTNNQ